MYAPHTRLARPGQAARTGPGTPAGDPATLGRTALLLVPVLLVLSLPPWLVTQEDRATVPDPDGYRGEGAPPAVDGTVVETVADSLLTTTRVSPAMPWLAAAVAIVALYLGHRLLRERRWPARAVREAPRGRSWYGVALGLVGVAALEVAVGGWLGLPRMALAIAVNATAVGVGSAFLTALLVMTGATSGLRLRLHRALDGTVVGLCLMFCGWVLMVTPQGRPDSHVFWIVMFHLCVMSSAVLAGSSPNARGRERLLCAAGVSTGMAGLLGLSFGLAHAVPSWWFAFAVISLLAAPVLIWRGLAELDSAGGSHRPRPPVADRVAVSIASNQVVAVAATLALAVALQRLVTGGEIDRAAVTLGTLAVLAVALRRLLAGILPGPVAAPGWPAEAPLLAVAAPPVPRPRTEEPPPPPVYTDAVTGLADHMRLSQSIAAMRCAPRAPGALLLIGVDEVGAADGDVRDDLLREVARRLRWFVEPGGGERTFPDLPARVSETEFAVLTPANLARAYALGDRLVALLAEPVLAPRGTLRLSTCVGLADLAGATSTEEVIHRARVALRRARQLGPGRVEWYDGAVAEAVARREILERDLPDAVPRGQLDLMYQPIMDLERGCPVAVEALVRWRHPRLGTLLPADVIPVAEETGVIAELDRWVLRRAAAQLAEWRGEGRDLSMSINVSARALSVTTFAHDVAAALAACDLPPDRLVLEVAESGIEEGADLDECAAALRELGVRTALDEFGTGVASLAHLRRLPIDMVKIGQSFFDAQAAGASGGGASSLPLIEVMVGVGRRLGIDVVAQGLEAPAQLTVVRTAGCRIGQGHLFAKPQPAEHTEAYLANFAVRR